MTPEQERVATPGSDPLDELRTAWRALEPPDATAVVDEPDAATRATLEWLRSAWHASEPAAMRALPWRVRLRIARPRVVPALPWLAAAAAVVLAAWLFTRSPEEPRPPPTEVATQPPRATAESDATEPPRAAAPLGAPLVPLSISAERMELRAGNVRLILLTPDTESNR